MISDAFPDRPLKHSFVPNSTEVHQHDLSNSFLVSIEPKLLTTKFSPKITYSISTLLSHHRTLKAHLSLSHPQVIPLWESQLKNVAAITYSVPILTQGEFASDIPRFHLGFLSGFLSGFIYSPRLTY